MQMKIVLFYVPFPTEEVASETVKVLLHEKLIACGNIVASSSMYCWLGDLTAENEWIAIMKTTIEMVEEVEHKIISIHPYDIPAIIHWEATCNESYGAWIYQQIMEKTK